MNANSKNLLKDWLSEAVTQLDRAGIASAKLDSELLAGFVLEKSRTWIHAHDDYELSDAQENMLNTLLKRRTKHEPLAYIFGKKEFYGHDFIVTKDVLVPRPESEAFIECIKSISVKNTKFIDIGTGSGILAITTALEQPSWSGAAVDISQQALKVAQKNAEKLGAKNLVFKKQNLLANDTENYDVVITNLPYVPQNLRNKPDIAFEPEIALFTDHDGLALYEALFQQITARPQKPTHILTESLITQHTSLQKLANDAGYHLNETSGLVQHFLLVDERDSSVEQPE